MAIPPPVAHAMVLLLGPLCAQYDIVHDDRVVEALLGADALRAVTARLHF